MHIGLGMTALYKNVCAGRRDGIGTYSAALARRLRGEFPQHSFSDAMFSTSRQWLRQPLRKYEISAVGSAIFDRRYRPQQLFGREFDLFHALDHNIPRMTIPVVATIHDAGPLSNPHLWPRRLRYWKNLLYAAKCRFPARVIAVSKFTADELVRYAGLDPGNIDVIYEGVGDYIVEESRQSLDWQLMAKRYGLEPGFVAYCGSISQKKNIGRLLQAHRDLPAHMQNEHPLVLIGGVPAKEEMHEEVAAIRERERIGVVKWMGSLPDAEAAKVLHHAAVFVFPSLHEGFGLPVVEAFQLGVPVLTSNAGSLPEIVGTCADLVDPLDHRTIAKKLEALLRDDSRRGELVEQGRSRAALFSWEKCARLTFEVYERVAS